MPPGRIRALSLAAALVGWKGLVAPRLPPGWVVPVHAALGGVLVACTNAPLGLRPPASTRGLRLGLGVAGAVSAAVAASTAVPAVRRSLEVREVPRPAAAWLAVRIPIGTVWSEEAAYRGALGTVAAQAFGGSWGRLLQATAFGLSHVADARGAGDSVIGTVLVTGAAGWAFGWLYDRTGSLAAPMLAHLASNEAGAVAALAVENQTARLSISSR
ncbi:MAG: protease family protein [Mycobacterium sp.]|nr:protease family protein [Mycobacterium sp.]